jgi:hypothetical protein
MSSYLLPRGVLAKTGCRIGNGPFRHWLTVIFSNQLLNDFAWLHAPSRRPAPAVA